MKAATLPRASAGLFGSVACGALFAFFLGAGCSPSTGDLPPGVIAMGSKPGTGSRNPGGGVVGSMGGSGPVGGQQVNGGAPGGGEQTYGGAEPGYGGTPPLGNGGTGEGGGYV